MPRSRWLIAGLAADHTTNSFLPTTSCQRHCAMRLRMRRLMVTALSDPSHNQPRIIHMGAAAICEAAIPAMKMESMVRRRSTHR